MTRVMRPEITAIQSRFFEALDIMIGTGQCGGLQTFCKEHGLNRTRYSNIRTDMRKPANEDRQTNYKTIDIDALAYLCKDYNVSADWLLLGKGGMFKRL